MTLRSPRERLGGYVLLPRLIDKVRLQARGQLQPEYEENLLSQDPTKLDGQFLAFTGLDGEQLRRVILSEASDGAVLAWVESRACPHTAAEKDEWAEKIKAYRPDAARVAYRRRVYPDLAAKVDVESLDVFDLIDMDEGRLPMSSKDR
ncbi:MAG: DUF5069 domain-containing protein [Nitrospira sp.]|nr:DUF5069 domain-containing protein [Nitrospira sp.]